MNENTQILLIGKTGHGKSALGNYLLDKKDAFVAKANPDSVTDDTREEIAENLPAFPRNAGLEDKDEEMNDYIQSLGRINLSIIDSPGLLDSNGKDNKHYQEMINYIKHLERLNGILLVINSQETRFSEDFQKVLKLICNVFEIETFKNIGIVFTKYFGKKKAKKEIKESRIKFAESLKTFVEKCYNGKKLENSLNYFFIDSDMDEYDKESIVERINILKWAKRLTYINFTKLQVKKDINHKEEYYKFDSTTKEYIEDNYHIKKTIKKKCLYAKDLDDKEIQIGEWQEYDTYIDRVKIDNSIWRKVLGGVLCVTGIIAAPFSAGVTLTATTGGVGLLLS